MYGSKELGMLWIEKRNDNSNNSDNKNKSLVRKCSDNNDYYKNRIVKLIVIIKIKIIMKVAEMTEVFMRRKEDAKFENAFAEIGC